ncbi:hypothetical protein F5884DRAFT_797980 [Xylogone sp. PMI_703]|nr:hypothetical protein F5884DRAFT_797980 [Xylogone sp. PMI_703]
MSSRKAVPFQGERVVWTTPKSYDEVIERLDSEINRPGHSPNNAVAQNIRTKEEFISFYSEIQGPAGFMQFHEFNHGRWIKLFGVGAGLRLKRVLLGNPLIAITMIRHDLNAGLCVPIELLIKELDGGKGTELVYFLPSSLIASINDDNNLKDAAKILDAKFERLLEQVTNDTRVSEM